ncbi:MAG: NUDIX hydrolase [Methylococcales bacterium]|nr:NUDIX hydrolase [Methylococcales bacterium]
MNKKDGAWAIIYCPEEDSILLGRRSNYVNNAGLWNHFGGKLNNGEPPKQGLIRELYEETKISTAHNKIITQQGEALQKLGCITHQENRHCHFYLITVQAEIAPKLNHEHSDFFWFQRNHLPKNINTPTRLSKKIKLSSKHTSYYGATPSSPLYNSKRLFT